MQKIKVIGKDSVSDIIIAGKYVSPKHALLIEEHGKVFIEDLDSTFGTFLNGKRISGRNMLTKKDRLKIGSQLFHWQDYLSDVEMPQEANPVFF